jgi:hypothetical protein
MRRFLRRPSVVVLVAAVNLTARLTHLRVQVSVSWTPECIEPGLWAPRWKTSSAVSVPGVLSSYALVFVISRNRTAVGM